MKFATSLAFVIAASLSAASAFAADKPAADKLTPQQQKMSDCSKDAHAKDLKGDAYKSYMSTCMKGTDKTAAATTATATTPAAKTATTATDTKAADTGKKADPFLASGANGNSNSQQQKMKACAADAKAKGLKGADRRTYMSTCLKKDSTAATPATPAK